VVGRQWLVEAAGLPCMIERQQGEWVVTIAAASVARAADLELAIIRASGGLVTAAAARELIVSLIAAGGGNSER
jgi:hypothetical protein